MSGSTPPRPRLFVGSSMEGRRVAELLRAGLHELAEVTLWCRGAFEPPATMLNGVLDATHVFDFAAFVMSPEEISPKRGNGRATARESVALQLGVFLGALGRQRTFIVCSTSTTIELPSDLRGVTLATYRPTEDGNIHAALGCACTIIKDQIRRLTPSAAPLKVMARTRTAPEPKVARRRRRESLGTAATVGPKRELRIADISVSGALLESFGEIPVHQMLDLDITLDDSARVRVTAKVVRIQHPQWGKVGGVGVAFVRFEGDSQAVLERYIESDYARLSAPAKSYGAAKS